MTDKIDEEVQAALKSIERATPDTPMIGKQTSAQSEKAIDQYRKRRLEEYEHCALRMAELSRLLEKGGGSKRICDMVAKSAVLLAEVYVVRREGAA